MRGICSSSEEEDMWTSGHRVRLTAVVDSREGPRIKSFNAVLFEGGARGGGVGKQKGRQSYVLYNEVADGQRRPRSERSGTPFRPTPVYRLRFCDDWWRP